MKYRLVVALLACAAFGCESADPQPGLWLRLDGVECSHGESRSVAVAGIAEGQVEVVGVLEIWNTGAGGLLEVTQLELTSQPPGVFQLAPVSPMELPSEAEPWRLESYPKTLEMATFRLEYLGQAATTQAPTATLVVHSNSTTTPRQTSIELVALNADAPRIEMPELVDFGNVHYGQTGTEELVIRNTGAKELAVDRFHLDGRSFTLLDGQDKWKGSPATMLGVTFVDPIIIPPGSSYAMEVQFSPEDPDPAYGELRFFSNDPGPEKATQGAIVELHGNVGGPCLAIHPKKVDFGGKLLGHKAVVEVQLLSCGDQPVEISQLRLQSDAEVPDILLSQDFSLFLDYLPGATPGATAVTEDDEPIVLGVNESATFHVEFVPDEINPKDENGKPIPDIGFLRVKANTFVEELTIEVRGFGVEVECPTAVIKVQEGEEVIPQTKLHFVGSQSYASSGSIAKYEWTVEQPPSSASFFMPNGAAPDPTFEVNVAGSYVFRLRVWDENMVQSCVDAELYVIVTPDQAIHIELMWTTPGDPDETDEGPEAGSNLDLHFLHPFATGYDIDGDGEPEGWFDNPFDCFWFNPNPDWGSHDPMVDDDPSLNRDDTDGAGPEHIDLNVPEDGVSYRIGVHYWNDNGWGPSIATVRVYVMSVLMWEDEAELVHHDMWEAATVAWPSGEVTPITDAGGNHKIIPDYQHPLFFGQ